ncbi:hypothetical protein ACE01N_11480 [Saccharicrinis sp. FJH2]|uniref:hypothetical protein n=1 Tax=Saccharicrinis sp. FJH65 TaxID=3344659 RepID=UPI0035F4CD82
MKKLNILLLIILTYFVSVQVFGQAPEMGKVYKIKNAVASQTEGLDLFIGKESPDNAGIISNGVGDEFLITQIKADTFNLLQLSSGKYLTRLGGWDGVYADDFITTEAQFTLNLINTDTFSIELVANSALIGVDNTSDGSSIYLNKGINNNAKWIFNEVTPSAAQLDLVKGYLQYEIDVTQALEGDFGSEETSTLSNVESSISAVTDWSGVNDLIINVHQAIIAYRESVVKPYEIGKIYRIKNVVASQAEGIDLYIGKESPNNAGIVSSGVGDVFMLVGVTNEIFNLKQISTGQYLSKQGGWSSVYADDPTIADAQFYATILNGDICTITCVANSRLIGTDATSDGTSIYMDKGINNNAQWIFEELSLDELKTTLLIIINNANTIYNTTVAGDGPGEYTGKDAFAAAISLAQSVYDNGTSTEQDVLDAVSEINSAIEVYKSTRNPVIYEGAYFDFGISGSPVIPNGIEVYTTTTYEESIGYGWISPSGLTGRDRGAPDDELRDFIFSSSVNTFRINVFPGEYKITIKQGDNNYPKANMNIYVNDVLTSQIETTTSGTFNSTEFNVSITENYIELKFETNGGNDPTYAVNSIQLLKAGKEGELAIKAALERANVVIASAVGGTEIGQYPQAEIDNLQSEIDAAQTLLDGGTATNQVLLDAANDLSAKVDHFISAEITEFTGFLDRQLYIIHSGGNLLSYPDDGATTSGIIKVLGAERYLQEFTLIQYPGKVGVFSIQSSNGKYLAYSGSWSTAWVDLTGSDTQVELGVSSDGYYTIKFVNKGHLGTNSNDDGELTWSDKSGTNILHKWFIQEPGLALKVRLFSAINASKLLLDNSEAGTDMFQFPADLRTALETELSDANNTYADNNATQETVDNMTGSLNKAFKDYLAGQIIPHFNPVSGVKYLMTNKSYTGYVTNNGTKATFEQNVPLEGWEFVKVNDTTYLLKSGESALAQSLNMVTPGAGAADQQWSVHYDGEQDFGGMYLPDTAYYFSFSKDNSNNALQATSTAVQIALEHSHSDWSQWFAIKEVGAPITDALKALIANVQSVIANTTVGDGFGEFPQVARDSLEKVLADAQADVLDTNLSQAEINASAQSLEDALAYYNRQKVVWKPEEGMGYFIGNLDNAYFLSVDTTDAEEVVGYKLDSVSFDNQIWFFEPVEGKAGFYHVLNRNMVVSTSGINVYLAQYDKDNAKEWEVIYSKDVSGTDYFILKALGSTYPNLHGGTNWGIDRFTYNNYQIKLVPAGEFRTRIYLAQELIADANVGNGLGQYPQDAYDAFKAVIDESYALAVNPDATESEWQTKLEELKAAEDTFRGSVTGSNFILTELMAAVDEAQRLLETTEVIGDGAGECPQSVVDALNNAIATAITVEGDLDQADVDARAITLNEAITSFVSDLKASSRLPVLIEEATTLHENAVEGTLPGQYATGSKMVVQQAITDAQEALDKEPVQQENLILAANALQSAIDNFNAGQVPSVDMQDLQDMIDLMDEFLSEAQPGEHADLRAKVQDAKAMVSAGTATQEQVDNMTIELLHFYWIATDIHESSSNRLNIYAYGQVLHVKGITENSEIKVYTINGILVSEYKGVSDVFSVHLNVGYYVVNVFSAGQMQRKVVSIIH